MKKEKPSDSYFDFEIFFFDDFSSLFSFSIQTVLTNQLCFLYFFFHFFHLLYCSCLIFIIELETSEQLPEQLRNLLNSKTEKEMKEEERTTAEIKQLKSEIISLNENKEEITKERDQLMERIAGMQNQVRNMTMKGM